MIRFTFNAYNNMGLQRLRTAKLYIDYKADWRINTIEKKESER